MFLAEFRQVLCVLLYFVILNFSTLISDFVFQVIKMCRKSGFSKTYRSFRLTDFIMVFLFLTLSSLWSVDSEDIKPINLRSAPLCSLVEAILHNRTSNVKGSGVLLEG